ncbi:MAG: SOS response-associated peptidase, partial [Clostridiaceae bacterium]|nr:SOS response-associated peptidase [Clostridiaceae bacterium]
TRDANASVSRVHHRMPVVLEQMHIRDWLSDRDAARNILSGAGPELVEVEV